MEGVNHEDLNEAREIIADITRDYENEEAAYGAELCCNNGEE